MPRQQQQHQSSSNLLPTQGQQSQPQASQQQLLSQIQSQPTQMQQLGLQQQSNPLQRDMQQRLQASGQVPGTMLQPQNVMDQQKQLYQSQRPLPETSSTSLDSTAQTGHATGGDWQEEVFQKIKVMKAMYLPELNEIYQKIATKLQQHDSLPQQPKSEQLDKLKMFRTMLERLISFFQISKSNISPGLKDKLLLYERHIINFIKTNRPRKPVSSLQQGITEGNYTYRYTAGSPEAAANMFAGYIQRPSPWNQLYPASYHLFLSNEDVVAQEWLDVAYQSNPLYLRVFGYDRIQRDGTTCTLVFTEPGTSLYDWVRQNPMIDALNCTLMDNFRQILDDTFNLIVSRGHGDISDRNIYIVSGLTRFARMRTTPQLARDVSSFVLMVRSFFLPGKVPVELDVFLSYINRNCRNLGRLDKAKAHHPLLMSASDRMSYRLRVGDAAKPNTTRMISQGDLAILEANLVRANPNLRNWWRRIQNEQRRYMTYFNTLHYGDPNASQFDPPQNYQRTALSFVRFNRNVAAHPPQSNERMDSALNYFMPGFLSDLFEELAQLNLYI